MNNQIKYLSELIYTSFNNLKQSLEIENCNTWTGMNLTFLENDILQLYNLTH